MPVPMINPLPQAPSRSDGPVAFTALADPFIAALPPFVLQANALALAINNALISIASSVDTAAGSASAAALSANAANSSKDAAAQQVGLAADQVALAAGQVALANAAKVDAQSAAVAAGAGAGLPVGREPFTALQINKAGAVDWVPGLPDRAAAQVGQSLMLDGDNLPKWAFAGQQIGDLLTTARNLPTDFSSVQATLPASVTWASVTYGKGLFVAVATSSNIAATSPDGINWTQRTLPASATWYAVTYGNGIFVAVGGGMTVIATSPDGITWTQRSAPLSATWRSVTYGGGLFVAVGISSAIAITSPDGINWTQRTLPASTNWYSVAYGNGVFVVTASSGSVCATSPDGITWTGRLLPASYNLRGIAFGKGLFVAVATSSAIAITSPDGINWTQRTLPASANWAAVTYGNGIFVAVANASANAATSPDGITWTQRALAVSAGWIAVAYGGGIYATIGSNSTIAATLVQGSGYLPANGTVYLQSAYPELFAKVGLLSSPAGSVWTFTANTDASLKAAIGYGNSVWIRANKRSTDNGVTFPTTVTGLPTTPTCIMYSGAGNIWVASQAPNIYRSTDGGLNWTAQSNVHSGTTEGGTLATDGAGTWISMAYSNAFKVSKDNGLTWNNPTTSPASGASGAVFIGNNTWLTINGYRSTDGGLNWTSYGTSAGGALLFGIMRYVNGVILAITASGIRRSVDGGFSWTTVNSLTNSTNGGSISDDGFGNIYINNGDVNRGGIYSSDLGLTWQNVAPIGTLNGVAFGAFGAGKFIASGAQGYMSSVETFDYDKLTQFKTPSPIKIQGLTHYVKAKEAA